MEIYIVSVIIGIFLLQVAIVAVLIHLKIAKSKKPLMTTGFPESNSNKNEFFDGKKYFFQKDVQTTPLYRLYGEVKQFDMNIPQSVAIQCDLLELVTLLDRLDPGLGTFSLLINDEMAKKTLRIVCDRVNIIEVEISGETPSTFYSGELVFSRDMIGFMKDYFAGFEVIKGFNLKKQII